MASRVCEARAKSEQNLIFGAIKNMNISYNWIQKHFDEKLPAPEKLAELLTMHSQEVESVDKKGDDYELDAKILPNGV